MKFSECVCILTLLLFPAMSEAQKNTDDQNNGWYMYFGNHKITNKLGLHTEYQWRRIGLIDKRQQSLARLGLDYQLDANAMVTAGYGSVITWPYGRQPVAFRFHEHRIWEQLILVQSVGRFFFNHRFRLEQRFIENRTDDGTGGSVRNGTTYRNRARYRFLVNMPLNKKSMEQGTLFASFYDEIFVQFGANTALNYLDQNRLYLALGYMVLANANVQAGYLNQFIVKANAIDAERNHTFQLALTYNFDIRKGRE